MKFQQSALTLAMGLTLSAAAHASPIVLETESSGFYANDFNPSTTDDLTPISFFDINFFGETFNSASLNENGNITFDGPYGDHSKANLAVDNRQIIAPFFADVDAFQSPGTGEITYGTDSFGGRNAFAVNWIDVSYFLDPSNSDLNSFQLILVDRQDAQGIEGDFDIVFNYDPIAWEFAVSSDGLSPLAGFSNPSGNLGTTTSTDTTLFELPGSGEPGAFLTNGSRDLASNSYNSNTQGRYVYEFRGGVFSNPPTESVPEPATLLLLGSGLLGLAFARRRVLNG